MKVHYKNILMVTAIAITALASHTASAMQCKMNPCIARNGHQWCCNDFPNAHGAISELLSTDPQLVLQSVKTTENVGKELLADEQATVLQIHSNDFCKIAGTDYSVAIEQVPNELRTYTLRLYKIDVLLLEAVATETVTHVGGEYLSENHDVALSDAYGEWNFRSNIISGSCERM